MSMLTSLLTTLKSDCLLYANNSYGQARNGALNLTSDALKGWVAHHAGVTDAIYIIESALNWLTQNQDAATLPATFLPQLNGALTPNDSTKNPTETSTSVVEG